MQKIKVKLRQFKRHSKNRRIDMIEFVMICARFAFNHVNTSVFTVTFELSDFDLDFLHVCVRCLLGIGNCKYITAS